MSQDVGEKWRTRGRGSEGDERESGTGEKEVDENWREWKKEGGRDGSTEEREGAD